ncbi:MAG: MarR family transcriptional regulator [Alphaproteobacteria bacterium]|nr:MarR family transcriptional regulator [Alphaproteobacteria bacterium]
MISSVKGDAFRCCFVSAMVRKLAPHLGVDWKHILSNDEDRQELDFSYEQLLFQLLNEIGIIHQLASTAFDRLLPYDLTGAQFTVLNHCVRMGDNKTPAQLAAILQVTRGTMTSTLARLEKKNFIRLEPDPEDGRSKRVFLTNEGRMAREASVEAALPVLSKASRDVPADTVVGLLPEIRKLRSWFDRNRSD